jgi:hypothetical protein
MYFYSTKSPIVTSQLFYRIPYWRKTEKNSAKFIGSQWYDAWKAQAVTILSNYGQQDVIFIHHKH